MLPNQNITNNAVAWYFTPDGTINYIGTNDNKNRNFAGIVTAPRSYILPDKSGTIAMLSDIPNVTGISGGVQLLGTLLGANLNSTVDQPIALTNTGSIFMVTDVVFTNASVNVTTATQGGIFTAASRGGTTVASTKPAFTEYLQNLTTSTKAITFLTTTLGMWTGATPQTVGNNLFFNLLTPQGSGCTVDIRIYGYIIG